MEEYLPDVVTAPVDDAHRRNSRIVEKLRAAATMIEFATKVDGDLPEVMSVGVNGDEISIQPWLPGAPVQALQHFEVLLTSPPAIERKAYPLVLDGATAVSMLSIAGNAEGHRVVISAATHQDTPVDGFLGIAEVTIENLAANETRLDDPADSDVLPELVALVKSGGLFEADQPAALEPPTEATEVVRVKDD